MLLEIIVVRWRSCKHFIVCSCLLSCEFGGTVKLISAEHRCIGSHLDGCMRARARVAARSLGTARPARGCPFSPRWRRRRVRTRAASIERAGARRGMAGRRRASAQRGAASTCSDRCTHARVWSVGRASRWTRRPAARRRPSAPALLPRGKPRSRPLPQLSLASPGLLQIGTLLAETTRSTGSTTLSKR